MRPGAGYLPTLALGRPRGPPVGVPRMTLLRTSPRPVYRVYSEEEFLTGEPWSEPADAEPADAEPADAEPADAELHFASLGEGGPSFALPGEGEPYFAPLGDGAPRPWGRIAAVTALVLAVVVVVGVVAMNEVRSRVAPERGLADSGIAGQPAHEDTAADSSSTARGSSRGDMRREQRLRRASTAIRRTAKSRALFAPAPPSVAASHDRAPARSHPAAALSVPASASAAATTAAADPVAVPARTATATETAAGTATATTVIAGRSGREFGFER
jgi:hypothetical protein